MAPALCSVVALALAVQPVNAPAESLPVQRPTTVQTTTPAAQPARDYAGVDALSDASPAATNPTAAPASPPEQTVPAPVATPALPDPLVEGPEDEPEPAYDPLVDSPEAIRARHWVNGGIVFTVVGGVLTIGGIAMSTTKVNVPGAAEQPCDPRTDPGGNGCTPGGRSRSVAALAIPGALLLAGGVAMLIVGKLQQRRVRASLQADKRGFMIGAALRF
jgi:hypothetical protein